MSESIVVDVGNKGNARRCDECWAIVLDDDWDYHWSWHLQLWEASDE